MLCCRNACTYCRRIQEDRGEVGDKVLAYDEETGRQAYKEVVRLFRNTTEEWYHIHVNGEEIVCTGGHPFYVASHKRFIPARELEVENTPLLYAGNRGIMERKEIGIVSERKRRTISNHAHIFKKCNNIGRVFTNGNIDGSLELTRQAMKFVNKNKVAIFDLINRFYGKR